MERIYFIEKMKAKKYFIGCTFLLYIEPILTLLPVIIHISSFFKIFLSCKIN